MHQRVGAIVDMEEFAARFAGAPDDDLAVAALAREVCGYRSGISTIFRNDFRASYRGAALGVGWNFIVPIFPTTVYVLLVNLRVFP